MRLKIKLMFILCALSTASLSEDVQRQDQLVWDYAEFVQEFANKNWSRAAQYINPDTKIGFGGEAGLNGLVQVFGNDNECHNAMVQALRLGCRKTGTEDKMHCVSPPHLGPDVVYLGARASFQYNVKSDRWMLVFLICGGD